MRAIPVEEQEPSGRTSGPAPDPSPGGGGDVSGSTLSARSLTRLATGHPVFPNPGTELHQVQLRVRGRSRERTVSLDRAPLAAAGQRALRDGEPGLPRPRGL